MFKPQINKCVSSIYCTIKLLSQIKHFLTNRELSILVSSLILSKIDYCNSLYYNANNGILQKLQIAQNSTTRLIYHKRKFDHVSSLLYDLHWLPIKQRIIYKICIIVYKCLHNSAPADISSLLHLASNKCTRLKVTFNQRKVSDGAIFSINLSIYLFCASKRKIHQYM